MDIWVPFRPLSGTPVQHFINDVGERITYDLLKVNVREKLHYIHYEATSDHNCDWWLSWLSIRLSYMYEATKKV